MSFCKFKDMSCIYRQFVYLSVRFVSLEPIEEY